MADQETANAGLEKVTDYVDEQELNADDTADALKNLAANSGASMEPSTESTQLKISSADIEQIQQELECSADEAKAGLIEASGDVVQALRHLLR
eukprot:g11069.t1